MFKQCGLWLKFGSALKYIMTMADGEATLACLTQPRCTFVPNLISITRIVLKFPNPLPSRQHAGSQTSRSPMVIVNQPGQFQLLMPAHRSYHPPPSTTPQAGFEVTPPPPASHPRPAAPSNSATAFPLGVLHTPLATVPLNGAGDHLPTIKHGNSTTNGSRTGSARAGP